MSGVPLHLMYNSAVFSSLATVEYSVYAGSSDLLTGNGVNWSTPISAPPNKLQVLRDASRWPRLGNKACIKVYGQLFVSAHGDPLAITSDVNSSQPAVYITGPGPGAGNNYMGSPYSWICRTTRTTGSSQSCDTKNVLKNASNWTLAIDASSSVNINNSYYGIAPPSVSVDYCLSKPMEESCRLQFSLAIMLIVIGCNLMKAICMLLTLHYNKAQPLVTVGDTVSSFLKDGGPATEGMCLAGKSKFLADDWTSGAGTWQPQRHWWFVAASVRRWLICNLL